MSGECSNCPSDNLYRSGRCQGCYRYFRLHGSDRELTMVIRARAWRRRSERMFVREFFACG